MARRLGVVLLLGLLGLGCNAGSTPTLDYAREDCASCSGRVVLPRFACLMVTPDGERRAYDSIDCLVRDLRVDDPAIRGEVYLPDHDDPGSLHPWAEMAVVRVADSFPEGETFAAFAEATHAEAVAGQRNGVTGSLDEFVAGTAGH